MTTPADPASTAHLTIAPKILYFGTPVVLLSTENDDGSANLAPISSAWALGHTLVMGLGATGHSAHNLASRPDLVANLPAAQQWSVVERIAPLTGRNPVPEGKRDRFRYEPDKFTAAGFRPQPSTHVRPPRIAECPLQVEARTTAVHTAGDGDFVIVEARVLSVHADPEIVVAGTDHIDPGAWNPLIYNFRHYFGLGPQLGHSFRSETASSAS